MDLCLHLLLNFSTILDTSVCRSGMSGSSRPGVPRGVHRGVSHLWPENGWLTEGIPAIEGTSGSESPTKSTPDTSKKTELFYRPPFHH